MNRSAAAKILIIIVLCITATAFCSCRKVASVEPAEQEASVLSGINVNINAEYETNSMLNDDKAETAETIEVSETIEAEETMVTEGVNEDSEQKTAAHRKTFEASGPSQANFNVSQAVSDYEYMWTVLYDNFPALNSAERRGNVVASELKKEFYNKIVEYKDKIPFCDFFDILMECLLNFEGAGHLSILDEYSYQNLFSFFRSASSRYPQNDHLKYLVSVLNSEKSCSAYTYLAVNPPEYDYLPISPGVEEADPQENIVEVKLLDEKTAYVKVHAFDSSKEEEFKVIPEFFETISACNSLIIDITGNSGGVSDLWQEYIVRPLIEKSIEIKHKYLLPKGELSSTYNNIAVNGIGFQKHPDSDTVLKTVNPNDLNYLIPQVYYYTTRLNPSEKKIEFSGDIYLLTDYGTYSAADAFTIFCKESGFADIVGTTSGGNGAGFFNSLLFSLPESGLVVRFFTVYGLNADGTCNNEVGTTPDYDSADGETPLKTCLKIIDERSN